MFLTYEKVYWSVQTKNMKIDPFWPNADWKPNGLIKISFTIWNNS